jgi:hypothetical protein
MAGFGHPRGGSWAFWVAANLLRTQAVLLAVMAIDNFGTPVKWAGLVAVALAVLARQVEGRNRRAAATATIVVEMFIVWVSGTFFFIFFYSAILGTLLVALLAVVVGALLGVLVMQGRGVIPID